MNNATLRWTGVAVFAVASAALGVSVWSMSEKLGELYRDEPVDMHYFIPLEAADFEYLGSPVRVNSEVDGPFSYVIVRYGRSVERLLVEGRDIPALGDLKQYHDWLRVLLLAGDAGRGADRDQLMRQGGPGSKLVLVARGAAPGYDADTWGAARYKDWVYEYLVFEPDGAITRFQRTYRQLADEPRSWEFVAAMNVTPSLHTPAMRSSSPISYPNYGPVLHALNTMGWTWPVSGVAGLAAMGGLVMFGSSFVSRSRWNTRS